MGWMSIVLIYLTGFQEKKPAILIYIVHWRVIVNSKKDLCIYVVFHWVESLLCIMHWNMQRK